MQYDICIRLTHYAKDCTKRKDKINEIRTSKATEDENHKIGTEWKVVLKGK